MVKIEKTPTPPASLAVEREKVNGSYRESDVIEQLCKDFHGKCYICELAELTDIQVEHLLPHYGGKRRDRMFDWNNLFYSCPHCNSIKKEPKYDGKIIDCCIEDPELLLNHIFRDNSVIVQPVGDPPEVRAVMTADLIQCSFQKTNTGIRTIQCSERFRRLSETMNLLYKTLARYQKNPASVSLQRTLRAMLKREYKFAAFTRYYVRSHAKDYPDLQIFLE